MILNDWKWEGLECFFYLFIYLFLFLWLGSKQQG